MKPLLLIALLLLSACAPLVTPRPEPVLSVEQLCADHRYLSALKALSAQRGSIPDYEEKRDAILAQAREHQNSVLRDAAELARQQQFVRAITIVENAQAELPASREMSQLSEQLSTSGERSTRRTLEELVPLKAVQLQKDHALYQALQKSATDPVIKSAVIRHLADVEYFSPLIVKAGNEALAQNEFTKAQQLFSIANQLNPSPENAALLARADQALANSRKKLQVAQSAEREQRFRELSNAMLQSLQQRDFLAAREQLALARDLNIHTEEMDSAQHLLDNIISNYLVQLTDAGNRLYADGKIEDALRTWRQAEALSPTPDIKEKIEKAQKFIDRLQQLQRQPATK